MVAEIAITFFNETPAEGLGPIFAAASVALSPSLGRSVFCSCLYFIIFPFSEKNHPLRPRIGSTTIVTLPSCLKKLV